MNNEIQKTTKIIDELSSLLVNNGSAEIDIKLKFSNVCTAIFITDYNTSLTDEQIYNLDKFLNIPRQTEVEEYYWGLMGETSDDDELFLVGSMIDSAKLDLKDGNLYIELIRSHK
jgi:hypothetical protein